MALPECVEVSIGDQSLQIRMPGGAAIPVMVPHPSPSNLQITKALMGQASGALAPLVPVFNIIDAILAIKDFADSVPGVVTDPGAVVEAIGALAEKVAKLAQLIPQLSVPFMVLDLVDVAIAALDGIVTQLEAVVAQEAKIAAATLKAAEPGNEALAGVVACATDLNATTKAAIAEGLGPLNSLFGVINIFLGLIGAPEIPDLSGPLPDNTQEAVEALAGVVEVLQTVRSSIPVP